MWFAVLVFVCLSVEVLSYLTGGDTKNGINIQNREKTSPEAVQTAPANEINVKYDEPLQMAGLTTAEDEVII